MPKVGRNQRQPKMVSGESYCRVCQKMLPISKFYEATNPMIDKNGYMSVCREHCNEIYNTYYSIHNNLEIALRLTCECLDVCFNSQALKETKSHIEKLLSQGKKAEAVFGYYKSKLSTTGRNNASLDAFRYKDSDILKEELREALRSTQEYNSDDYDSIEIEYLKEKWGSSLPPSDLKWLEEKYNEWDAGYEIQGKSRELIVQQICFEELFIYQARQTGEDVTKRIKTIRDLMNDGNFSPKKETASETAEFQTLAEFIKKVEQTKPFVKEGYNDVDKMGKMWKSLAGAINRTQGKPDEYTKIFEEEYAEYTMDLSNVDSGGDR
jgi:hypothetical protein